MITINAPDGHEPLTGLHDETIRVERCGFGRGNHGLQLIDCHGCEVIIAGLVGSEEWREWTAPEDWPDGWPIGISLDGTGNTIRFEGGSVQGFMNGLTINGSGHRIIGQPGKFVFVGQWGDHLLCHGDGHTITDIWTGGLCHPVPGKHCNCLQVHNRHPASNIEIVGFYADRLHGFPPEYPLIALGGAMHVAGSVTNFAVRDSGIVNSTTAIRYAGVTGGVIQRFVTTTGSRIGDRDNASDISGVVEVGAAADAMAMVLAWRAATPEPDKEDAALAAMTADRDRLQSKINAARAALE